MSIKAMKAGIERVRTDASFAEQIILKESRQKRLDMFNTAGYTVATADVLTAPQETWKDIIRAGGGCPSGFCYTVCPLDCSTVCTGDCSTVCTDFCSNVT